MFKKFSICYTAAWPLTSHVASVQVKYMDLINGVVLELASYW